MKKLIPVIVAIALVVGGYFAWQRYGPEASSDRDELGGSGTIEADEIAISPQVAGRVIQAPAEEGAAVKKGDVLYRLDAAVLKLQVEQAQAGVDAARSNYTRVRDDSDSTSSEKAAARAQRDQAQAALKMAKVQLGYATITSPIDGSISSIAVREGENAVPGSTMAVIGDTANLTVTIYIPENRIGQVKLGQTGTLTTDSTAKPYNAKVIFIASDAEFTPSSTETKDQRVKLVYEVKLAVANTDEALKPGMPADVVLK